MNSTPSFDQAFGALINWQSLLFCLGIYAITYVIRSVVEALWKKSATSNIWNELFLHVGPIATGMFLGAVSKAFPFPLQIGQTMLGRILYGAVTGLLSGWVYGRLQAWLNIAADKNIPVALKLTGRKSSAPPPPNPPSV